MLCIKHFGVSYKIPKLFSTTLNLSQGRLSSDYRSTSVAYKIARGRSADLKFVNPTQRLFYKIQRILILERSCHFLETSPEWKKAIICLKPKCHLIETNLSSVWDTAFKYFQHLVETQLSSVWDTSVIYL